MKYKLKKIFKEHWDELFLLFGLSVAAYYFLRYLGKI